MEQFLDFHWDGYAALRVRDVTEVRSGKYERHWQRMLAAEGLLDENGGHPNLPLNDIGSLLQALRHRDGYVIVECEDEQEDIEDFYIGNVLAVDQDTLSFANFDGLGRWDSEAHEIPLDEITKLQIDTPYANTFAKYLEGPCPLPVSDQ